MVIAVGGAFDDGSEFVEGTRAGGLCFGASGGESPFLASGLVEPDADVFLPVLPEVHIGNHVVMFDH